MSAVAGNGSFISDVVTIIAVGLVLLPVLAWHDVFRDFFKRLFGFQDERNQLWYALIITVVVVILLWLLRNLSRPKVIVA